MNADKRVQAHFDKNVHEYAEKYVEPYTRLCNLRLEQLGRIYRSSEALRVLDLGCGAGIFSDLLLQRFPRATVVCVDLSLGMLKTGKREPRKRFVQADCTKLPFKSGEHFDVVNIDAVMHHLISDDGYRATVSRIAKFLRNVRPLLRRGGCIAIREIFHESFLAETLHSRLMYAVSSKTWPPAVSSMLSAAGLRTASVGVCFLSRRQWKEMFAALGPNRLDIEQECWRGGVVRLYRALGFRANGDYNCCLRFDQPLNGSANSLRETA